MKVSIVSLFPEMFTVLNYGVIGRAQEKGLLTLDFWNPRDFAKNKHRTVDDRPYGGGPGMVMLAQPLKDAICAAKALLSSTAKVIHLSPQGRLLTQESVRQLSQHQELVLVASRYEGVDERLIIAEVDEEWSIGDYVLTGGELASMVMVDAIARVIPGVLGDEASAQQDSFETNLLDCPHYTRPDQWEGLSVPEELMSGDHQIILRWRLQQALGRTWLRRPDLLSKRQLTELEETLLAEFIRSRGDYEKRY